MLFKNLEHLPQRAHLRTHSGLGNGDDGEIFAPGYAGDEAVADLLVGKALHDKRAGVIRLVRVADVERNILLTHREHRALMQHLRAHVAQLAQLVVGYALDGVGIVNYARIGHEYAGNVCPVLIQIRIDCFGNQRTGNIGTAAGESNNCTIFHGTVKSRNDSSFNFI